MLVNPTFLQTSHAWLVTLIIFILIIVSFFGGHYSRLNRYKKHPDLDNNNTGAISGILFGLFSLLLAFTFNMANSRYDKRRELIVEEANDIGTAILRTQAYPDSMQQLLIPPFKEYVEERIAFSEEGMDLNVLKQHYLKADSIGRKIWAIAVSYVPINPYRVNTSQLLPALNNMIDITTTRRSAGESTIPDSIMYFLFILTFCSAYLLGYSSKDKIDWVLLTVFAIMICITLFTIIDLDRPRSGLINMDSYVQKLVELRGMFK